MRLLRTGNRRISPMGTAMFAGYFGATDGPALQEYTEKGPVDSAYIYVKITWVVDMPTPCGEWGDSRVLNFQVKIAMADSTSPPLS